MSKYIDRDYWISLKKKFRERMIRDRYIGYLDPGIESVLEKIFMIDNAFPTSSCSGRIYAVDAIYPWIRRDSYIVFKKHDELTFEELRSLLRIPVIYSLWLIVSGPIIHINTYDPATALRILRIAREAGFKHSGLLSRSRRGYIVEIVSGVRLDLLLKEKDDLLIKEDRIELILEKINKAFRSGRERLHRLSEALDKLLKK
ncbi:MAG: tRNA(Phe) 7-((3-amino-3-carboxypropyl)-4-demethylwyosine(37)-N(4))-methyltransferase [Sulfolobales archaeon]